ncbi:hypothetical protein PMAYCL1PPCAC_32495, partial [Pristionchus mayeri]
RYPNCNRHFYRFTINSTYNRPVAFVRDCESNDTEYADQFKNISDSIKTYEWKYALEGIDPCRTPVDERENFLKAELVKYEFFIIDQQNICDEYYPEVPYYKRLSMPLMTRKWLSPPFPEHSTLDLLSLDIPGWKRRRNSYFRWTDEYTRAPFHGMGMCEICTILSKNGKLSVKGTIDPYICKRRKISKKSKKDQDEEQEKAKQDVFIRNIMISVSCIIGAFVFINCAIALYFPISNTIRRLSRSHTE